MFTIYSFLFYNCNQYLIKSLNNLDLQLYSAYDLKIISMGK